MITKLKAWLRARLGQSKIPTPAEPIDGKPVWSTPATKQCPSCKHVLDAAMNFHGLGIPKKDDVSVCFYCGIMLEFTDNQGTIRILPPEAWEALPVDIQAALLRAAAMAESRTQTQKQTNVT